MHRHYHTIADGVFKAAKLRRTCVLPVAFQNNGDIGNSYELFRQNYWATRRVGPERRGQRKQKGAGWRKDRFVRSEKSRYHSQMTTWWWIGATAVQDVRSVRHLAPSGVGHDSRRRSSAVNANTCKQSGAHEITRIHGRMCPSRPADDNLEGQRRPSRSGNDCGNTKHGSVMQLQRRRPTNARLMAVPSSNPGRVGICAARQVPREIVYLSIGGPLGSEGILGVVVW